MPPVRQTFTVDASQFLAGIDEMIAGADRLAESLNIATGSTQRLAGASESVAGSESAVTDSISANAAAFERQGIAVDALVQESRALAIAVDEAAVAIDRENVALDATAASAGKADGMLAGVGSKGKMAFFAVAAAVGYAVVKAADFQSSMTRLNTQAGVAKGQLAVLGKGVLQLASHVGEAPGSLADSLYHVESSFQSVGITAPKALQLVQTAAEGARLGNADLVDVTNALDATMVAHIPGIQSYSQAMGALNAIVGSGDMTMQDLASAMGSGVMAVATTFGQSIYQVGAALATLGDDNIRGAKAATDLRMAWQAVLDPLKTGAGALQSLGLTSTQLGTEMTHHGLTAAVGMFIKHLNASKVPISDWGQYVTEIFGKRAGVGIGILISQYERFKGKLPDLEKGAKDFGSAWTTTTKALSQQWHNLLGGIEALAVSFGTVLLPAVTKVLGGLAKFFGWLEKHPAFAAIAGGIIAVAAAMGGLSIAIGAVSTLFDPITLIAAAVVGLGVGIYEAYKHCAEFRSIVRDVAQFFKSAWNDAVKAAGAVIKWFTGGPLAWLKQQIAQFTQFWRENHAEIERIVKVVWGAIEIVLFAAWAGIKAALYILQGVWTAVWDTIKTVVKTVWDVIGTYISTAIKVILNIISAVLDLIQGHWGQAWDHLKTAANAGMHGIVKIIEDVAKGFGTLLFDAGKALITGLIHGIESMAKSVWDAVFGIGQEAKSGATAGISSAVTEAVNAGVSSAVTGAADNAALHRSVGAYLAKQVLKQVGDGAASAVAAAGGGDGAGGVPAAAAAATSTALTAAQKLKQTMDAIALGLRQRMMANLEGTASEVKAAISKIAGYIADAVKVDDITQRQGLMMTAMVERDNGKLIKLADQRAMILKTIAAAQKYATSTASNVQSWASLSNAMSSVPAGGAITGAGLLASLQTDLATIRQFNAAIQKLAKLGLNKNLLNQIIQAGPTDGLTLAEALLSGPVSQIAQLNKTEQQITVASNQIGRTAANAMYDTGKYAGQGFLTGLKDQQKSIEDLMGKIADSMIKRLKKDLGIHSPSSVAHWHGLMFVQGLAQGLDDGKTYLDAAMGRLSGAMHVQMPYSAGIAGGGGGGNTYKVDININFPHGLSVIDAQTVRELQPVVQAAILQLENRNPTSQITRSRKAA